MREGWLKSGKKGNILSAKRLSGLEKKQKDKMIGCQ
jgi:hypothetical protein